MQVIPLQSIANQAFSVFLDGSNYDIALKATNGVMSVDIVRDGVAIISGQRVVANETLIPYTYLETGNFGFLTNDDDIPYFTNFNVDQTLLYFSPDDLTSLGR